MFRRRVSHILLCCRLLPLLLVGLPGVAHAGAMSVDIVDAVTSRPLAGVVVTAESRSGESRRVTTGSDGSAYLEDLADGFYAFRAELDGYVPGVEPTVRIIERRTGRLRFELRRQAAHDEEVVVVGRARGADPDGSVADRFLTRDELRNAPGSGSDVMRALVGLPGVVSSGEFASFSVRGHGPKNNLIFVDGFPFPQVAHFEQTLGKQTDIVNGGRYSIFAPNAVTGAEFSPGGWSAEFGGRKASLLQLEVAEGTPSPVGSLRLDLAGIEAMYEGPSGFHDNTSMFVQARRFDFGKFFETIEEDDLGSPVSTDLIFKTKTRLENDDIEFLLIFAPETYERTVENVLAAKEKGEGAEDLTLQDDEQDLMLTGVTWRRRFGDDGEWTNRVYFRESDKVSSEGEANPDLVPDGTPAAQVPARERLLTVTEKDGEFGWRSDITVGNVLGRFSAGLHVVNIDLDYSTTLREDWIRFIYESDDPRPPGANYIILQPAEINSLYVQSETNYALYGEQVFDWGRAHLRTGLRYDYDGFSDESLLSPRIAFNYEFSPSLRFSATTGVFYESPRNLARALDPANFGLKNEKLTHVGAGLDFRIGENLNLLVDAYSQRIDRRLVEGSRVTGEITNDGKGSNRGVDVVLTRAFDNGFSADFVYSWNRYRVDDNDGRGEYNWDFNRVHFVALGGRWELNERWQIAARWRYGSGQPGERFITHADVLAPALPVRFSKEITETNVGRGRAFNALDFRVDYRRPIGRLDLVLFLDVLNLNGGPSGLPDEFDILTGQTIKEDEETLPLLGLTFEYSW
ncbi:MAG TPA: TonB-dependent receptor [Gammaproteobacteria bacterium]